MPGRGLTHWTAHRYWGGCIAGAVDVHAAVQAKPGVCVDVDVPGLTL